MSWMIFGYSENFPILFTHDLIVFILISFFSLGSYLYKLRRVHLFNVVVAIWLIAFSLTSLVPFVERQNYIVIALLLLMFAIIPSPTDEAPYDWQRFFMDQ